MKTQTFNFTKTLLVVIPFALMSFTNPKEVVDKAETSDKASILIEAAFESIDEAESLQIEDWMTDDEYWKSFDTTKKVEVNAETSEEELKIEAWMSDDNLCRQIIMLEEKIFNIEGDK